MPPPSAAHVRRRAWQRMHVGGASSPLLLKAHHGGDDGWLLLCLCVRTMRVWQRADDGRAFAAFRAENNAKLAGDALTIQQAISAVLVREEEDGASTAAVPADDDEDGGGDLLVTAVDCVSHVVQLRWPITFAAVTGQAARGILAEHVVRPLLAIARLQAVRVERLSNALPSERAARLLDQAEADDGAEAADVAALTDERMYALAAGRIGGDGEPAASAAVPAPLHVSPTVSTGDAASLLDFESAADDAAGAGDATTESQSGAPSADMTAHEEQSVGDLAAQLERKRQLEEKLARERRKKAKRAKKGPTFV